MLMHAHTAELKQSVSKHKPPTFQQGAIIQTKNKRIVLSIPCQTKDDNNYLIWFFTV